MNFTLPSDAMWQIASTTGGVIAAYISPAYIVMGVLLALYILERIFDAVSPSTHSTGSPDSGT